jgi:type IV pilus assembly protein PilF
MTHGHVGVAGINGWNKETSMPIHRSRRFAFWLTWAAVLLAGWACVSTSALAQSETGIGDVRDSAAGSDISTASDETPARRRARIRLELAGAYFGRGQLSTALDEVKQAITLDGNYSEAYEMRGLIYDALNEPRFAEESFRRALQINSRNGSAAHNLAWFLCRRQDYARADEFFQRAADFPGTIALSKTLMARGVCQLQAGSLGNAEKYLARSHELDPSNPAVSFNMALVLYRMKEYERARFYARRVNNISERASAASLWLGARIEHKLNNLAGRDELAIQLRNRFGSSREVTALELGRFDE